MAVESHYVISEDQELTRIHFDGTGAMSGTLDNAAAVDAGSGIVTLPITGHGMASGSHIYLSGTTNYDGDYIVVATATNTVNIYATYVAETFGGTEVWGVRVYPDSGKTAFQLTEVRLHAAGGALAAEAFTISLDSGLGSEYDVKVYEQDDMSAILDLIWSPSIDELSIFFPGDALTFAHTNTNSRTVGLEVHYRHLRQ